MSAQHTPGPWAFDGFDVTVHNGVEHHDFGYVSVADKAGEWQSICSVQGSNPIVSGLSREECEANAALISAAPELLEALRAVVRVADRQTVEFDLARAAIDKAEGRS